MGVRNTKLIMYGVQIQYPHYKSIVGEDEERYEELDIFYHETPGKVGILSDGMSGQYAVAGSIIVKFNEDDELIPEGPVLLKNLLNYSVSEKRQKEVQDELERILGWKPACDYYFVNHYH